MSLKIGWDMFSCPCCKFCIIECFTPHASYLKTENSIALQIFFQQLSCIDIGDIENVTFEPPQAYDVGMHSYTSFCRVSDESCIFNNDIVQKTADFGENLKNWKIVH